MTELVRIAVELDDATVDRLAKMMLDRLAAGAPEALSGQAAPPPDPWAAPPRNVAQAAPRATETDASPLPGVGGSGGGSRGYAAPVEPRSTGSGSYAGPAGSVLTVKGPNGMQTWTLNPPNGPMCDCNEPAALVHGPKAKGGFFDAYRCAKGAGDDWRNKCSFNKWT